GMTIGEALLVPHRCYVPAVLPLLEDERIYGIAHITGGGLYDNIPRVLPSDLRVVIERRAWTPPTLFGLIQQLGGIDASEMYRAFNMGIGMVLLVDRAAAPGIVARLNESGETAAIIGEIQSGSQDVQIV
ncbi:phosphoribosylformylglycinamidine cyclo-ligase, partial [bacterium]